MQPTFHLLHSAFGNFREWLLAHPEVSFLWTGALSLWLAWQAYQDWGLKKHQAEVNRREAKEWSETQDKDAEWKTHEQNWRTAGGGTFQYENSARMFEMARRGKDLGLITYWRTGGRIFVKIVR